MQVRVSSKYRVVTHDVRKLLNIQKHQKMQLILKGNAITLIPVKGIDDLRGFLSGVSTEGLREEDELDGIQFGPSNIGPCNVDFAEIDPKGNINGLSGLDLLLEAGAVVGLKNLLLYGGTRSRGRRPQGL